MGFTHVQARYKVAVEDTSHRGLMVSITDYELGGLGSNSSRGIAGFFDSDRPLPRVGVL
jgi:hypothetical protein